MASQAVIQARIDALEEALASGTLSVRQGDKSMEFRSVDEIQRSLTALRAQLAGGRTLITYLKLGGR